MTSQTTALPFSANQATRIWFWQKEFGCSDILVRLNSDRAGLRYEKQNYLGTNNNFTAFLHFDA
jgi:hypothetical protein